MSVVNIKRSTDALDEEVKSKVMKTEKSITMSHTDLNGASFVSVLNDNRSQKTLFLHGKFNKNTDNDAVIILEKKPFDVDPSAINTILSSDTKLELDLQNDIYTTYNATLPQDQSKVKATVIYPATKKHLEKYRSQKVCVVSETKSDYFKITKPFIEKQFENNVFNIKWVYNILEHKQEKERIIFEDPAPETGFILLPDMKWDMSDHDSLYVIAIPHKRDLKSLRDITDAHIPLLKNIQNKSLNTIKEKFNVGKDQLRMYFHYQPSYYHLHIHINSVAVDMPGTSLLRAHLLQDVIENLSLYGNYYKEKTFSFILRENDKLLHAFKNDSLLPDQAEIIDNSHAL